MTVFGNEEVDRASQQNWGGRGQAEEDHALPRIHFSGKESDNFTVI